MSTQHDCVGVLSHTYMVPPKYDDERIQRVVALHNNFMASAARFHTCSSHLHFLANLETEEPKNCSMAFDAVLFTRRKKTSSAAHTLIVELYAKYNDHFTWCLNEDITDFLSTTIRPHMVPIENADIPASELGHAIGPNGSMISNVARGAWFVWSPKHPTQGLYTVYVPSNLAKNKQVRDRALELSKSIHQKTL